MLHFICDYFNCNGLLMNLDEHRLRVLELNSWQLLRLLRAQLPALPCSDFPCHLGELQISDSSYCNQSIESKVCCLFAKATLLHASWRSKNNSEWAHLYLPQYIKPSGQLLLFTSLIQPILCMHVIVFLRRKTTEVLLLHMADSWDLQVSGYLEELLMYVTLF